MSVAGQYQKKIKMIDAFTKSILAAEKILNVKQKRIAIRACTTYVLGRGGMELNSVEYHLLVIAHFGKIAVFRDGALDYILSYEGASSEAIEILKKD